VILYDHPVSANCLKGASRVLEPILLHLAEGTPFLPDDRLERVHVRQF
jgi:hypothetical protein